MNNGRINKNRGFARGIPQISGEGIRAHEANGGKESEDGSLTMARSECRMPLKRPLGGELWQ